MLAKRRRKIMGIPVGPARRSLPVGRLAGAGAVGATALAAVPAARRAAQMAGKAHEVTDKVSGVVGAVGSVEKAVSSHSSTVGKAIGLVGAVKRLGGGSGGTDKPKLAHLIEENTEISVSRSVAYNQWTQMEMLPSLVKGVQSVDQEEDDQTQWKTKIGPVRREWKAKIIEQVPDERIVWESQGGPEHHGVVSFHSLDEELTRVLVQIHYVPHGPFEVVGNKLRIQRRRVRRDLRLFKHFLELRGEETGAWRGSIGENSAGRQGPQSANGSGRPAETSGSSSNSRSDSRRSSGSDRRRSSESSPSRSGGSGRTSASSRSGASSRSSASNRSGGSARSANGRASAPGRSTRAKKEVAK